MKCVNLHFIGAGEELRDEGYYLIFHVFQYVMPGVGIAVYMGIGEAPHPLGEKGPVEYEVPLTPENRHGEVAKACQSLIRLTHKFVATVTGIKGYILDEAKRCNAVPPRVVGKAVGAAELLRHRVELAAYKGGGKAEGVQSAHQYGAEHGVAADSER